jgi:hypothetical protein
MAKRKSATKHDKLTWKPARQRWKAGLRIRVYNESTGCYRVSQFLAVNDLPFIALLKGQRFGHYEQIGRHATFEEAKAACERHLREQSGG